MSKEYILRNGEPMTEAQRAFAEERMEQIRKILHGEAPVEKEAKMYEFPSLLSAGRRERVIDQGLERLKELREAQINEQRKEQGLPSLRIGRQQRESQEYAPGPVKKIESGYDPFKRDGESCHRGPSDSDSDL
jgi:hypothetical protein